MNHELPFTPWDEFMAEMVWEQGEHVTVVGPTGTGKTTLLRGLMAHRYARGGAVVVLATKPKDANLESWARHDELTVVRTWPPKAPQWWRPPLDHVTPQGRVLEWEHRVMLWPKPDAEHYAEVHREVHRAALLDMFVAGNVCIVGEELHYLCAELGLDKELVTIWTQGRSNGISLVGATQRPVNIPLYAYSSASHLFFFNDNDETNLKRIQGIGGMQADNIRRQVGTLPKYDVLYIGTRDRATVRTRVPIIQRKAQQ